MNRKIIIIFVLELSVPIIFLLISTIFYEGNFNEIVYQFVLPIVTAIFPIVFTWLCDKEIKIREEKVKNYNLFLDALTIKFSNINNDDLINNINENFCKEANRLSLYASDEVIEYINKIANGEKNNTSELLQKIRKDLVNTDFKYSSQTELMLHVPNTNNKK